MSVLGYRHTESREGPLDGARLFLVLPGARTRGSGHKLELGRFCLNTGEHSCAVWVMEPWHRLPCGVSLLEIFKICWDAVLGNLLQVALFAQGAGPDGLCSSLPASAVLLFCDFRGFPPCICYFFVFMLCLSEVFVYIICYTNS